MSQSLSMSSSVFEIPGVRVTMESIRSRVRSLEGTSFWKATKWKFFPWSWRLVRIFSTSSRLVFSRRLRSVSWILSASVNVLSGWDMRPGGVVFYPTAETDWTPADPGGHVGLERLLPRFTEHLVVADGREPVRVGGCEVVAAAMTVALDEGLLTEFF